MPRCTFKISHTRRCNRLAVPGEDVCVSHSDDKKRGGRHYLIYTWDGSSYNGEWLDNKRHGSGVFVWLDGSTYKGEWLDNKRHGSGVFVWLDGSTYEGEWLNDKAHGHGVYVYINGETYNGEWLNGMSQF